jgi:hypothetical protein
MDEEDLDIGTSAQGKTLGILHLWEVTRKRILRIHSGG